MVSHMTCGGFNTDPIQGYSGLTDILNFHIEIKYSLVFNMRRIRRGKMILYCGSYKPGFATRHELEFW